MTLRKGSHSLATYYDPLNDDSVPCISVVCMVAMLIAFRELIGIKIWVPLFSTKFCSYEG
jgi:hypothetical protein